MRLILDRDAMLRRIQALDPEFDHQEICHLMAGYEFPWDMTRSLELALLRTFCVPSISRLLDRTGEFHQRPQKRYDDTGLIVSALFKWGYDDPRGAAFLRRMNGMHGRYAIANDDFLYVLSTFIYEPIRWCDRFGWRGLDGVEKQGLFYFWRAVGDRMGIRDIPSSYEAFEDFNQAFEVEYFQFDAANQAVADATLRMFLGWFPGFSAPLIAPGMYTLLDERMRVALGWPEAPGWLRRSVVRALRLRSGFLRQLPPRQSGDFFVDHRHRSYPQGFEVEDLGPLEMLESLNRRWDE
jgi:ER-bound oxygenase mpaB/B'/Rubber oxygenase, catalytic domain